MGQRPQCSNAHKLVAGRPRDLEDVRSVMRKNPEIDPEYVRRWLKEFDASLGKPLTKQFEELSAASRRG